MAREPQRHRPHTEQHDLGVRQLVAAPAGGRQRCLRQRPRLLGPAGGEQGLYRAEGDGRSRPLMDRVVVKQRLRGRQRRLRAAPSGHQTHPLGGQLVAQRVVTHELLGFPKDGVRFLGTVQGPEQVARGRHRHRRALVVVRGLRRQVGEQPLPLGRASGAGERPPERQPCAEAGAGLHRGPRETLGQYHVGRGQRLVGRTGEQLGVAGRSGFQSPDGDPQQVAAPPPAMRLHRFREPCVDRLDARCRQLRAHGLAVQRMGEVDEPPPFVGAALDELAALERLEGAQLAGLQQPDLQWSAERHELQHAASARVRRPRCARPRAPPGACPP